MLDGTHPYRWYRPRPDGTPVLIWMCSQDSDTQRDVLQKKWEKFIPDEWVTKVWQNRGVFSNMKLKVPNVRYGELQVEITWKTYDSKDKAYEGASVDGCVADEEPPEAKYQAIKARLLDAKAYGNGWFSCAMSPVEGEGWSVTEIYDKRDVLKNTLVIEMSTYDNAVNLGGVEAVREFELDLLPNERPARIYGRAVAKTGRVINRYIDQRFPNGQLVVNFMPDWRFFTPYESIDWGRRITSVGFYAVNRKGQVFRYAEAYLREVDVPDVKAAIYKMRLKYKYRYPRLVMIDPNVRSTPNVKIPIQQQFLSDERNVWVGKGVAPTEQHMRVLQEDLKRGKITEYDYQVKVHQYFSREGYISFPIPVCLAKNARDEGWEVVNEYLTYDKITGEPKYFISEQCIDARREYIRLVHKQKTGKKVKGDDHACDETRYLLITRPVYVPDFDVTTGRINNVRKFPKPSPDSATGY